MKSDSRFQRECWAQHCKYQVLWQKRRRQLQRQQWWIQLQWSPTILPRLLWSSQNFLQQSSAKAEILPQPFRETRRQEALQVRHRAHRGREGLLHRGPGRHLRGGPPGVEVQLCVLAQPRAGDHAGHLVPWHLLATRGLRARRQDRGRAHQAVPRSQDGRLRLGRQDVDEAGDSGEKHLFKCVVCDVKGRNLILF